MEYYTLRLYDKNGTELWNDESNEWNAMVGFREDMYDVDLAEGTYYVKVSGYGYVSYSDHYFTGNYTLVTGFTSSGATETENNDSISAANSLGMYGTVKGQIALNDGYDYYCITLTEDRCIKLDIISYMEYYTLCLYDASGTKVWNDESNEWNSTAGFREDTYYVNLVAGTYYVEVCGYGHVGWRDCYFTGTYKITLNYIAPPEVKASAVVSTGKTKLSWDSVEDAIKYKVYRSTNKSNGYKLQKTVTGTAYTDNTAVAGTKYYYKVVAVDACGGTSKASNIVSRTCDLARPVVTVKNYASTGKINVTWKAVSGAVKYQVYRATAKNGTYKLVKTTTSTKYYDSSAVAGTKYYYKVVAVCSNKYGNSAYSAVQACTCDLARPVISLSNNAATGKNVVTWKAISGASSYKVYRATSKNGTYKLIKTTTYTKHTDTTAVAGKKYYYKVIAVCSNKYGNSAASAVKYRVCDLARPDAWCTRNADGDSVVKWDAVKGAIGYKVYRATGKNGNYTLMKTTKNTSFTNTSAVAGKTYYYKVIALYSTEDGNSAYSTVVSITAK